MKIKKNSKRRLNIKLNVKVFSQNIFIVLMLLLVFNTLSTYSLGKREFKTNDIVVEANTTIWNIAKNICNKNTGLNVQNVIMDIKDANNLNDSDIYVGQVLKVPEY